MEQVGRVVIVSALILLAIGVVLLFAGKLGLGKLPGDIVYRRGNFTLYVPLVTSLLVSAVLTLLLWLFRR